ncbi:dCMP deaminase [Exiguobacterium sp. SH5S4]|uniref:deoxycytidylate deaminase n=1 Tax=Exiguobacterium sp. SH5S4 TaxID=2510961 RepID=UPI00103B3213|nr:deaminase [Exiguobacterium sp. SH5S4]TCI26690.1 dCMP deaminase [Exiguobacterium sp. SH5S4]
MSDDKVLKWDKTWMNFAIDMADTHSKCASHRVACVLVKDDKPISIGVNGTIPGATNCNEIFSKVDGVWHTKVTMTDDLYRCDDQLAHHKWSKENEIHAEINALAKVAKSHESCDGATAYVTLSPCRSCALAMIASGIKRVVYLNTYDKSDSFELFRQAGVELKKLNI